MDELVDIWDTDGNPTGEVMLKSEAHRLGLFHPVVHVWCFSELGKVLLQQRGKEKETHPLKWDVSVAGHIGTGENVLTAAFREAKEEIGISIKTAHLIQVGVFKSENIHSETLIDREFTHTFLYPLDEAVNLTKQESEVEALRWITLDKFEILVAHEDEGFVPDSTERYQKVFTAIRKNL